jgi:hypothetical protein
MNIFSIHCKSRRLQCLRLQKGDTKHFLSSKCSYKKTTPGEAMGNVRSQLEEKERVTSKTLKN